MGTIVPGVRGLNEKSRLKTKRAGGWKRGQKDQGNERYGYFVSLKCSIVGALSVLQIRPPLLRPAVQLRTAGFLFCTTARPHRVPRRRRIRSAIGLISSGLILAMVGCGDGSAKAVCDLGTSMAACGSMTCTTDQACARYQFSMAPMADMGPQTYLFCMPIPSACQCDRSCACLEAHGGGAAACAQTGLATGQCSDSTGELRCVGL